MEGDESLALRVELVVNLIVHPRVDGVREHVQKGHSDDGAGREDDGEGSKNRGRVHASSGGGSEEGRVDPFLDCGLHRLASELLVGRVGNSGGVVVDLGAEREAESHVLRGGGSKGGDDGHARGPHAHNDALELRDINGMHDGLHGRHGRLKLLNLLHDLGNRLLSGLHRLLHLLLGHVAALELSLRGVHLLLKFLHVISELLEGARGIDDRGGLLGDLGASTHVLVIERGDAFGDGRAGGDLGGLVEKHALSELAAIEKHGQGTGRVDELLVVAHPVVDRAEARFDLLRHDRALAHQQLALLLGRRDVDARRGLHISGGVDRLVPSLRHGDEWDW
mmetsp:Transcript_95853/g.273309  ORF Transcript_95853/g.273309 Transcript_95853/m.273309 type:complete len:336 (-) Transcript_95853:32-1039(-)